MIILAIIAAVASLAAPSLLATAANAALKAATRDLYGSLQEARLTAIKTNSSVRILFRPGSYFIDANGDGTYTPSPVDTFTDLNGDGAYNRGEPYTDADADGTYSGEVLVNFNDYGHGVTPGSGNALKNWSGNPCTQRAFLTFNSRGTSNSGTIYLNNCNHDICYAVTARSSGSLVIRRYDGTKPFSTVHWH